MVTKRWIYSNKNKINHQVKMYDKQKKIYEQNYHITKYILMIQLQNMCIMGNLNDKYKRKV